MGWALRDSNPRPRSRRHSSAPPSSPKRLAPSSKPPIRRTSALIETPVDSAMWTRWPRTSRARQPSQPEGWSQSSEVNVSRRSAKARRCASTRRQSWRSRPGRTTIRHGGRSCTGPLLVNALIPQLPARGFGWRLPAARLDTHKPGPAPAPDRHLVCLFNCHFEFGLGNGPDWVIRFGTPPTDPRTLLIR
jgi:hypothetical protein